jgi:site-specific DNA recombinase
VETCILYLRESDDEAKDNDFTIQEDKCRAYALKQGYPIVGVYREAHSGKHSPLTRKVLREAINEIKAGHAKVMVIRTFDRLARDLAQMYAILFEIEQVYHGRIEAAEEPIDRTSSTAKMQLTIAALASEMERDRIEERTQAGKRKRAEMGLLMAASHPLYGYDWADPEKGKRTTYVVDPVSGPVVKAIFERAAAGQSTQEITRWLNAEGVPSPSVYAASQRDTGNRRQALFWHRESVRSILKQPAYAGKALAYRHLYSWEYRDEKERLTRTRNGDALSLPHSTVPAIVKPEVFQMVQERLKMNTAGRKSGDPTVALFRGHVFCGVCGSRMFGQKAGGSYVYCCSRRRNVVTDGREACPGGNFAMRCHAVNTVGWEGVKEQLANKEGFAALLREQVHSTSQQGLESFAEGARGALEQKLEEQQNLATRVSMTSDDMVARVLIEKMEATAQEVGKLQAQVDQVESTLAAESLKDAWIDETLAYIYTWAEQEEQDRDYDKLPDQVKRLAVMRSGIRVYVFPVGWQIAGEEAPRTVVLFNAKLPIPSPVCTQLQVTISLDDLRSQYTKLNHTVTQNVMRTLRRMHGWPPTNSVSG